MSIRTFGIAAAVVLLLLAGYGVSLIFNQWQHFSAGAYEIRYNRLTGVAQVKAGGEWASFRKDPYAQALSQADLKRLTIRDIAWGPDGLLCATAINRTGTPVRGRLAFHVLIRDAFDNKFVKDRTLRETVDFPPNSETAFLVQTGLETPDLVQRKTSLLLEPTSYSGP